MSCSKVRAAIPLLSPRLISGLQSLVDDLCLSLFSGCVPCLSLARHCFHILAIGVTFLGLYCFDVSPFFAERAEGLFVMSWDFVPECSAFNLTCKHCSHMIFYSRRDFECFNLYLSGVSRLLAVVLVELAQRVSRRKNRKDLSPLARRALCT